MQFGIPIVKPVLNIINHLAVITARMVGGEVLNSSSQTIRTDLFH